MHYFIIIALIVVIQENEVNYSSKNVDTITNIAIFELRRIG